MGEHIHGWFYVGGDLSNCRRYLDEVRVLAENTCRLVDRIKV